MYFLDYFNNWDGKLQEYIFAYKYGVAVYSYLLNRIIFTKYMGIIDNIVDRRL